MRHTAVETPGDDGHIHIVPTFEDNHIYTERCWCKPKWDAENRKDWVGGWADHKVIVHNSVKEMEQ